MKYLLTALLFATSAHAETADPLWEKVIAQSDAAKKWVAQDVDMVATARAKGEDRMFHTRGHLSGWDGNKPRYDTTMVEQKPVTGKKADAQISGDVFAQMADGMIKADTPYKRRDGQVLDGKTWTVFEVDQSQATMDFQAKIWVDPVSGGLHLVDTHMRATLMMDLYMKTRYAPHAQAGSLPSDIDMNVDVLIPFKNAKLHIVSTNANWIAR
ncbi:MAG: hypothetical protein V4463_16795 [Pseudomonadota bacterium]